MRKPTPLTSIFVPEKDGALREGQWTLPDDAYHGDNVTVHRLASGSIRCSCSTQLQDVFRVGAQKNLPLLGGKGRDGGGGGGGGGGSAQWTYLCYQDISSQSKSVFVLRLHQDQRYFELLHYAQDKKPPEPPTRRIVKESVPLDATLHDIFVHPFAHLLLTGPGDDVHTLVEKVLAFREKLHEHKSLPWLLVMDTWILVKACPHAARNANDDTFLRLPLVARDQTLLQYVEEQLLETETDEAWYHWATEKTENTEKKTEMYHDKDIAFVLDRQTKASRLVRQSCNKSGCRDITKAALVIDHPDLVDVPWVQWTLSRFVPHGVDGILDYRAVARTAIQRVHAGQGVPDIKPWERNVTACKKCWPAMAQAQTTTEPIKIKVDLDGIVTLSPGIQYCGGDPVSIVVTHERGGTLYMHAYQVLGGSYVDREPFANASFVGNNATNVLEPYDGARAAIYDLPKIFHNGEPVTFTLEKISREDPPRFCHHRKGQCHDCGLVCDLGTMVKWTQGGPPDLTHIYQATTATIQAAENEPYKDLEQLDPETQRIARFFQGEDVQVDDDGLGDEREITFHGSRNSSNASKSIKIDIHMSVKDFGQHLNEVLMGTTVPPTAYKNRYCHGVLIQYQNSDLEVVVGLAYTTVDKKANEKPDDICPNLIKASSKTRYMLDPRIAVRLPGKNDFKAVTSSTSLIPTSMLGMHLDKATVTLFRFCSANKHCQKWFKNDAKALRTILKRPHEKNGLPPEENEDGDDVLLEDNEDGDDVLQEGDGVSQTTKRSSYRLRGKGGGGNENAAAAANSQPPEARALPPRPPRKRKKANIGKIGGGKRRATNNKSSGASSSTTSAATTSSSDDDNDDDAAAAANDSDDGMMIATATTTTTDGAFAQFKTLCNMWPLLGVTITAIFGFVFERGTVTRVVGDMIRLLVDPNFTQSPVENLVVRLNCMLVSFLPPDYIKYCNALVDALQKKNSHESFEETPFWGDFNMEFVDWKDGVYEPKVDINAWKVQVPQTQDQWNAMTGSQRRVMLAQMLAFPVFYFNCLRTKGKTAETRGFLQAIQKGAPWLPIHKSYQRAVSAPVETVSFRNKTTKVFNERRYMAPKMYHTLFEVVVGEDAEIDLTEEQAKQEHNDVDVIGGQTHDVHKISGSGSVRKISGSVVELLENITDHYSVYLPKAEIMPLLQLNHTSQECHEILDKLHHLFAVDGKTGTGKTSGLSFFLSFFQWVQQSVVTPTTPPHPSLATASSSIAASGTLDDFLDMIGGAGNDIDLFLELLNFGKTQEKKITASQFFQLAREFARKICDKKREQDADVYKCLFDPQAKINTDKLIDLRRDMSQGSEGGSTSKTPTAIFKRNTGVKDFENTIVLRVCDFEQTAARAKSSKSMEKWVHQQADALDRARPHMVLRWDKDRKEPLEEDQKGVWRGMQEGVLNAVHGVQQEYPKTDLGSKHKLPHPGIIESVNIMKQMCIAWQGFIDRIGAFETDNSVSNGNRNYSPVSIVYVTNSDSAQIDIITEAAKWSGMVVVVMNVPRSEKKDIGKSPKVLAQQHPPPSWLQMEKKINEELDNRNVDNVKVVSADVVAAVSMLIYMDEPSKLRLKDLQCAMAVLETNLPKLLWLLHQGYLTNVAMLCEKAAALDARERELESATQTHDPPNLHASFYNALNQRNSAQVAKEVLGIVYGQADKLARKVEISTRSIEKKLNESLQESKKITSLVNLKPRGPLAYLKCAFKVVNPKAKFDGLFENVQVENAQVEAVSDGVSILDRAKCQTLVDDLIKCIIRDCDGRHSNDDDETASPYSSLNQEIQRRLLLCGRLYCEAGMEKKGIHLTFKKSVDHYDGDQISIDTGRPLQDLLMDLLELDVITIKGRRLLNDEFRAHQDALRTLGVKFFHVVSQFSASSLVVNKDLAPDVRTIEAVLDNVFKMDLLQRVLESTWDTAEQAAEKIAIHLKEMINKSFATFVVDATIEFMKRWHPEKQVLTGRSSQDALLHVARRCKDPVRIQIKAVEAFAKESLFSPCLVQQLVAMFKAVNHFKRKDVANNDHHPFPRYVAAPDTELAKLDAWRQALGRQMDVQEDFDANDDAHVARLETLVQEAVRRHDIQVSEKKPLSFRTPRRAIAYLRGRGFIDIGWTGEAVEEAQEKAAEEAVMTMGKTSAYMVPLEMGYLALGARHPAFAYLPTIKTDRLLNAHMCLDDHGNLKCKDSLGVDEDLYAALRKWDGDKAKLVALLEAYPSTGENLLDAIVWELLLTAVTLGRAIAFFIHSEDGNVLEFIFRPRLPIEVPHEVYDALPKAYQEMVDKKERYCWFIDQKEEPLDVVCAVDGKFYVLFGEKGSAPNAGAGGQEASANESTKGADDGAEGQEGSVEGVDHLNDWIFDSDMSFLGEDLVGGLDNEDQEVVQEVAQQLDKDRLADEK